MTFRPRIILADDHAMFREGLALLLPPELVLVAAVANGRELVAAVRRLKPDLVVADLTMPKLGGLEALQLLRQEGLQTRFVILTVHADPALAAEALRAGAMGYVVKHAAGVELLAALRLAVAGRTYLSPLVSEDVVRRLAQGTGGPATLRPRQREVLRLLAEGRRAKEIAVNLGLSVRTVETHKYQLMHRLDIDNTADLVKFAIRQGIVTP
jgi:DNA-binding NarL/FixJ family response regulator